MRKMFFGVCVATAGLSLGAVPLLAHHGAAALDTGKEVVLKGSVTEWIWSNPHSASLRVEERYHRVNQNTMELTVTIDDPVMYTKPWTPIDKLPMRLMPSDTDLMEMITSASEAAAYKRVIASQAKTR